MYNIEEMRISMSLIERDNQHQNIFVVKEEVSKGYVNCSMKYENTRLQVLQLTHKCLALFIIKHRLRAITSW